MTSDYTDKDTYVTSYDSNACSLGYGVISSKTIIYFIRIILEVDGTPIGKCLRTYVYTHAETDGQPENIMIPAPSIGRAVT